MFEDIVRTYGNISVVALSAADMTKKSLVKIYNDKELRNLKGHLVLTIHDENILESPLRYARATKKLFAHDMETAAGDRLEMAIKCDVTTTFVWNGEELDLDNILEGLEDGTESK